jgi:DNA-binding MarR family transcriptional regulator
MTTAPVPPTPPAPALSGQDINVAARATRQVLVTALEPMHTTFEQWTVINLVGSGQVADEAALRARLSAGIGLTEPQLDALLQQLEAADLITRTGRSLALATAGERQFEAGSAVLADIVGELYGGLDPEELATTRRILVELTARATARLERAAA